MHPLAARAIKGTEPIATLVKEFYGWGGPLIVNGWQVRAQQREMSLRFAEQLDENAASVGVIEAPTGCGKGMAYLVPGIFAAFRAEHQWFERARKEAIRKGEDPDKVEPSSISYPAKFVVSTANISLQGQLTGKDIPSLAKMLGLPVRVTLMKSRRNYVCREELASIRHPDHDVRRILDWLDDGGSGDREDVSWPVADVWPRVSKGTDDCLGESCTHWHGEPLCCWRAAVEAWPSSHVIVANHHWTALSGGLASVGYAIDEAHELEDALRSVQGHRLLMGSFSTLATRYVASVRAAALTDARDSEARRDTDRTVEALRKRLDARVEAIQTPLFDCIRERRAKAIPVEDEHQDAAVTLPAPWVRKSAGPALEIAFADLIKLRDEMIESALDAGCEIEDGRIRYVGKDDKAKVKAARAAASVANRAIKLAQIYSATVLGRAHPDWCNGSLWAIWTSLEDEKIVVELTPADVAPVFGGLFARYGKMLLTSATLPAFPSLRLALGLGTEMTRPIPVPWPAAWRTGVGKLKGHSLDSAEGYDRDERPTDPLEDNTLSMGSFAPPPKYEVRLPSPYPLPSLGVLVIPHGPLPTEPRWRDWAVDRVVEAVTESRGGALILASSMAQMRRYAEALRLETGFKILCQGEAGRAGLIASFKADRDSVLCATRSFFAGVDVQGQACRLVLVDRVPFASPDDPVEKVVGELLVTRAKGGTAWRLRSVVVAGMTLAQGVGRLIRAETDYGAAVILDGRILEPRPGWREIRLALPPFPLHREMAAISRHLSGA
jgi:ATP-dependent DNA helicase DinG